MSSAEWLAENQDKVRGYKLKWYRENKKKQIAKQLERRRDLQEWLWMHKRDQSCTDCGMPFKDCPECCDWHHLDPLLKDGPVWNSAISSKAKAIKEIAKCIPLCANCHRKRHKEMYRFS